MSGILSYHSEWSVGPQHGGADINGAPENFYKATTSPWYGKGTRTGQLTVQQMFDFAKFLWKHDPTFQQGIKRVIGYFLTDFEFFDPTRKNELKDEDITSYRQVLDNKFNLKYTLSQVLQTYCLYGNAMQLNAMGIPPQFHRGNLELQVAPMAARLFEAHWQHIPSAANTFLDWLVHQVTPHLGWKEVGIRLTPPKIADNLDQLMLLMQLHQVGELSATTLHGKVGLERSEEKRRQMDEAIQAAKMDVETQAELDKIMAGNSMLQQTVQQQQAMMAGGGAPDGGGEMGMSGSAPAADPVSQIMMRIQAFANPAVPKPITEYHQIAQEAAAIFSSLPLTEKRAKLREIDQINKPLADMIRTQMEQVNNERNREFVAQGQAAMQQQGGGMAM